MRGRFAYAFYATDETYGCAALVAIQGLKNTGVREDIDIVLIMTEEQQVCLLSGTHLHAAFGLDCAFPSPLTALSRVSIHSCIGRRLSGSVASIRRRSFWFYQ